VSAWDEQTDFSNVVNKRLEAQVERLAKLGKEFLDIHVAKRATG
jgi:hypothetical protein